MLRQGITNGVCGHFVPRDWEINMDLGQYFADYGWLTWIIIGLVAGLIAKAITPGRDPSGCIITVLLGIAGALLAGFIGQQLGWYERGEGAGFLAAIIGAVILLLGYRLFASRR